MIILSLQDPYRFTYEFLRMYNSILVSKLRVNIFLNLFNSNFSDEHGCNHIVAFIGT